MTFPPKSRNAVTAAILLVAAALAATVMNATAQEPVGPKLTPKLHDLIRQEMAQMLVSTNEIATAIVTGDHETVADHADKIVAGFIMKRSLTDKDKKDLKGAVPTAFLELDAGFHQTAEKLLEAARNRDAEQENAIFSQMMHQCVACHSAYASDRFPGFAE